MGLINSINNKTALKKLRNRALKIDALKDEMASLTDEQLKEKTRYFQQQFENVTDLKSCAVYIAESHGTQMEEKDGFYTFTYEDLEVNEPQMYVSVVLEAEECYWLISAYCPSDIYDKNAAQMWACITAAKTVKK